MPAPSILRHFLPVRPPSTTAALYLPSACTQRLQPSGKPSGPKASSNEELLRRFFEGVFPARSCAKVMAPANNNATIGIKSRFMGESPLGCMIPRLIGNGPAPHVNKEAVQARE